MGMCKKEFMHSTMKDITLRIESYRESLEEKIKLSEYQAWLIGMYVTHSIACNFNKHSKYPKNPIEVDTKDIKQMSKITGKTEEELRQEEIYMTLLVRQANANIAKVREEREASNQEEQVS